MPYVDAPHPCWIITVEGDRLGCGASLRDAVWLAAEVWAEELLAGAVCQVVPAVILWPVPCVRVCCEGCGRWLADGVSGDPLHCGSQVAAVSAADDQGWWGDVCPACQPVPATFDASP